MVTIRDAELALQNYTELNKALAALEGEREQRQAEILAPVADEIKSLKSHIEYLVLQYSPELTALEDEIARTRSDLTEKVEAAKKQATELALAVGRTVKSNEMMAVYIGEKRDWNGKMLEGYAQSHPEVLGCSIVKPASITIRKR